MKIANSYDIFISSPGDVKGEIDTIKEAIDEFNREHRDSHTRILTVRWDSDIFLRAGIEVQKSVDEVLKNCDFVVAVFRKKLGTPTGEYDSGTVKEIQTSLDAGKQVFVFYLDGYVVRRKDREAYDKLMDFIDLLRKEGRVRTTPYTNCSELKYQFLGQLRLYYHAELKKKEIFSRAAEEMERRGITCIKTGNAPDEILREKISEAKCVKVLSLNAAAFHKEYLKYLVNMLKDGGELKLLLPNPQSKFLEDIQEIQYGDKGMRSIHDQFSTVMSYLQDCLERSESQGKIHIGCSYSLLRQKEIICINKNGEIWTWVTMLMPPLRPFDEALSFGAQSDKDRKEEMLAHQANYHFDKLWEFAERQGHIIEFGKDDPPTCFYEEKK